MAGGRTGGVVVARTPGRPSKGPKLVRNLDGSAHARKRLEMILETVSGKVSVREACERLGVKEAAFYKMRTSALEAALARLEPRPMGRPPMVVTDADKRVGELETEIKQLKMDVATSQVREELALTMPFLAQRRKQLDEEIENLRAGTFRPDAVGPTNSRGKKGGGRKRCRAGGSRNQTASARPEYRTGAQRDPRKPPGTETRRTDEGGPGDDTDAS